MHALACFFSYVCPSGVAREGIRNVLQRGTTYCCAARATRTYFKHEVGALPELEIGLGVGDFILIILMFLLFFILFWPLLFNLLVLFL